MKDAATLLALAEKCEALAGPDREVEAAIHKAVFGIVRCPPLLAPLVTKSLDAAIALVPEGWWPGCQKNRYTDRAADWSWWLEDGTGAEIECFAATSALALTAAALRAHAAIAGEG